MVADNRMQYFKLLSGEGIRIGDFRLEILEIKKGATRLSLEDMRPQPEKFAVDKAGVTPDTD